MDAWAANGAAMQAMAAQVRAMVLRRVVWCVFVMFVSFIWSCEWWEMKASSADLADFSESFKAKQRAVLVLEKSGAHALADVDACIGVTHQPRAFVEFDDDERVGRECAEIVGRRARYDGARAHGGQAFGVMPIELFRAAALAGITCERLRMTAVVAALVAHDMGLQSVREVG